MVTVISFLIPLQFNQKAQSRTKKALNCKIEMNGETIKILKVKKKMIVKSKTRKLIDRWQLIPKFNNQSTDAWLVPVLPFLFV